MERFKIRTKIRMENWLAFQQGCKAGRKYTEDQELCYDGDPKQIKNPYPKDSDDWYSWNRGFNST